MLSAVRTVEATPTAPPTAFFPCNLCAYLWPDICLPAAIYGGRDNSNKGLPPRHWTGIGAQLRTGSDISDKAKLFKTSNSSFPIPAPPGCCHVAAENGENVKSWRRISADVLFPAHLQASRSAAGLAAFRQINKFLSDGRRSVVSNDYAHETWIDDRHPLGDSSNN